ncbi:unnamed protein product [Adineta steineri]|uniref:G-protein coupled receptors family 1 profile domain-containing protein n=1 Tax=Adineta steineri TaxID=433720 RepID=A0A819TIM0_9BILA|nr:unnamed protein product [Adineta steineri]
MTTSVSYLTFVQNYITRYGMSTYVAFGNLGNILTIAVFYQVEQRRNPCSLYLLSMTICNLVCLDVGIIPIIYSLDHPDISTQILLACKLQFYIRHAFFQMMRTYKVLACIDRYALCSTNVHIRSFSQRKISIILIIVCGIFWLLIVIFFGVVRTIKNNSCNIFDSVDLMIYTIYYLIFAGLLPPTLIIIFTMLVFKTLKQLRSRVKPTAENGERNTTTVLRKRDRDLIKMVFIEVMFYTISTLPFSIYLIYSLITSNISKSKERQQVESFVNYLTQSFIMYFNTALPFYIYFCTSPSFRKQLKRVIIKYYCFIMGKDMRLEQDDTTRTITAKN